MPNGAIDGQNTGYGYASIVVVDAITSSSVDGAVSTDDCPGLVQDVLTR